MCLCGSLSHFVLVSAKYIRNWQFDHFTVGGQQDCQMVFTSVVGHLMEIDFGGGYRKWNDCNPGELFHAPIHKTVPQVIFFFVLVPRA